MNPEERLDHLLDQHADGADAASAREAGQLDAAQAVRALRAVPVPTDFAARLEARLRLRARELQSEDDTVAAPATSGPTSATARRDGKRGAARPTMPPMRRIVFAGGGALTALVLLAGLLFAASAQSVPGDWLYGVKQLRNQIALAQAATPAARAEVLIQQLHGAVSDLQAEISSGHGDANIQQALRIVASDTQRAQTAVAALPAGTSRTQATRDLAATLTYEQTTLHQLVTRADWPVRLAISGQIGALGAPVPTITAVAITAQGNGDDRVTITGTNFATAAQVLLDDAPAGPPLSLTPTRIVIRCTAAVLAGPHQLGVQNPDGTAASYTITGGAANGQGAPQGTTTPGTPGAQGTPGNGNGNGNGHHDPTPSPQRTPGSGNRRPSPTPASGNGSGRHTPTPGGGNGNGSGHPTPTPSGGNGHGK